MSGRTVGAALVGAFVAAWVARAVFVWILDVPSPWPWIAIGVAAVLGGTLAALGDAEDRAQSPG